MAAKKEVVQQIVDILTPMVPQDGPPVTADLDLVSDLGLNSMKVMELIEILEDSFDISIPINILSEVSIVKDLAVEIQNLIGNE